MSKAAKTESIRVSLPKVGARKADTPAIDKADKSAARTAESDVLHFLTRTLQAHYLDGEPTTILTKLKNLKVALYQQELTLSHWPDSPSKDRMCEALAKARNLVTQIVDEFGGIVGKKSAPLHDGEAV